MYRERERERHGHVGSRLKSLDYGEEGFKDPLPPQLGTCHGCQQLVRAVRRGRRSKCLHIVY